MPSADRNQPPPAGGASPEILSGPLAAAAAISAFVLLRLWWMGTGFLYDDAFITFRYARNLASGAGFVFNEGEWVLGTSAPAFGLLLAGLAKLGASIPLAAKAIGLAGEVLSLLALRRILADHGRPRAWWGVLALFALDPLSVEAGIGGMEAPLFMAAVLWSVAAATRGSAIGAGALLGVATLLRPDGVLAAAALLPWAARRKGFEVSEATSSFLAVTVPFAVWGFVLYGTPVPHSVTAKLAFGAQLEGTLATAGSRSAVAALFAGAGSARALTALAALGLMEAWRRRSPLLPLAAHAGLVLAGLLVLDPVFFPWYAYLARPAWLALAMAGGLRLLAGPRLPALAAFGLVWLGAAAIDVWVRTGTPAPLPFDALAALGGVVFVAALWWLRGSPVPRRAVGLAALALLVSSPLGSLRSNLLDYTARYRAVDAEAGEWLNRSGSPTVAAWEIGYLGWAYEGRVVDLVGLVSPTVTRRHSSWTGPFDEAEFLSGVEADWVVADWRPGAVEPTGAACFSAPDGAAGRCLSPGSP